MPPPLNANAASMGVQFLGRAGGSFPDPWDDMASKAMPRSLPDALRWAQSIAMLDGTYRQAMDRVVSYFLTDIEVTPARSSGRRKTSKEEKEKFEQFLTKTLQIKKTLHTVAQDLIHYNNSFNSILVPFRRHLICPKCHLEMPLKRIANAAQCKFQWKNFEFHASCPKCSYRGAWKHVDRRSGEEGDVSVKRWPPHEIDIVYDQFSDQRAYIWRIPESYRRIIREGTLFHLERVNWEVVEAIKSGSNLMFDAGVIYHLYEPALAGVETQGWGLPRAVVNFRQAWHCQVLRRMNEAIAMDFIVPFRVIAPPSANGQASDPVYGDLGNFTARVNSMIRRRRKDPAQWNVLPFPIEYQAMGGEAQALAPYQLIDQAIDQLLNAAGVPAELYKGTLSMQAAPAALRLFESHWAHLVDNLNRFLEFVVDRVAEVLNWEPVDAKLAKVTHADDLNRQMAKLQLMAGKQISQTTGLNTIGLDFKQEQEQLLEEEKFVAERQQELSEEMEGQEAAQQFAADPMGQMAAQDPNAMPPQGGGMPPAGGGGGAQAATPDELMQQAQQIAEQLMQMPESQRQSEMIALKREDRTLHSLVKGLMDDLRQQAQTEGGNQVLAQQFGKTGSARRPHTVKISARAALRALAGAASHN